MPSSWVIKLSFYRFSDKTKNDWEDRNSFEKVHGKYDLLKMDYEANADVSVFLLIQNYMLIWF